MTYILGLDLSRSTGFHASARAAEVKHSLATEVGEWLGQTEGELR